MKGIHSILSTDRVNNRNEFHSKDESLGGSIVVEISCVNGAVGGAVAGSANITSGPLAGAIGIGLGLLGGAIAGGCFNPDPNQPPPPDFPLTDGPMPPWAPPDNPLEPPPSDPLVLDLDGDGIELISVLQSDSFFDIDNDGFLERVGWVGADDGLLARDVNGNGQIDNLSELFGSDNEDAFTALAVFDENEDGMIDINDSIYAELKVWRDLDGDGTTDTGELVTLADAGVASIGLAKQADGSQSAGNNIAFTGTFTHIGGATGAAAAVFFAVNQQLSQWQVPEEFEFSEDSLELPFLKGYGNVSDLHYAMTNDQQLLSAVRALVLDCATMTGSEIRSAFEGILTQWTGTSAVDPDGRGPYVDGQHLAIVEAFYGSEFTLRLRDGSIASHNPNSANSAVLEGVYQSLVNSMLTHFLASQAGSYAILMDDANAVLDSPFLPLLGFAYYLDADRLYGGFDAYLQAVISLAPSDSKEAVRFYDQLVTASSGLVSDRFNGDKSAYLNAVSNAAASIDDVALREFFYAHASVGTMTDGSSGADQIVGSSQSDLIYGQAGTDLLSGGSGSDTYVYTFGDGADTIDEQNSSGGDKLLLVGIDPADVTIDRNAPGGDHLVITFPGSPSDSITIKYYFSNSGLVEDIVFADGTVWQNSDVRGLLLSQAQTSGNDLIYGFDAADLISAAPGDDVVYGRQGNDTLVGGAGNDTVSGDGGDDTYVFNLGDGQDVIKDYNSGSWGGNDTIQFGPGIAAADLVVSQANGGQDLVIAIAGTTDQMRIQGGISGGSDYRIEQVRLDDGTVLTHAQLLALSTVPTSGNDVFYGDETANILNGGIGSDTLSGRQGHDTLVGGAGDDTLSGDGGDDTYVFNLGDGQDVIKDYNSGSWGGNDTIQFGPGIAAADLVVSQANGGQDLVIAIAGTTDQIRIQGGISGGSDYRIEQVRLDDGTVLTHAQLLALSTVPTSGNDVFYGDETANILNGGAGNDTLSGRQGNDTLSGGAGNDTVSGDGGDDTYVFNLGDGQDVIKEYNSGSWGGNDTIQFGPGIAAADLVVSQANGGQDLVIAIAGTTDQIRIQGGISGGSDYRIEQVRLDDGTVLTHAQLLALSTVPTSGNDVFYGDETANILNGGIGSDTLSGRQGHDTLVGGAGDDTLSGDGGDDTYVFNLGDGQDVIKEYNSGSWGGNDTIQFGPGIAAADLVVSQANSGQDLVIAIAGTTDQIRIQGGVSGGSDYRIERVRLDDGTVLTHAQLMAMIAGGTSGNDTISGDENTNILSAGSGNDVLSGRQGNDILIGGAGNDTVSGDGGDDTYIFHLGDGQDVIKDYNSGSWGGNDTIQFGPGIAAADLVVSQANGGQDLVIAIAGTTDQIRIQGGISGGSDYRIEQVQLDDGTVLTHAQLLALSMVPTSGNDVFSGDETANILNGGAGNDTLSGRQGNDTLSGGAGNDTVSGDGGDDTYVFNLGDGQDVIKDYNSGSWGGNDTIQFGPGIAAADLVVSQANSGQDLIIAIAGTTDQIRIQGGISGGSDYRIEQVRLDDGTVLTHAQLLALSTMPTSGNDVFYGDEAANILNGGAGNDTLSGRQGNDTLSGGAGNDTVSGDGGDDTYVFNLGDGQDVIKDYNSGSWGGNDTIQFGPGIAAADLVVSQANSGQDLIIAIAGTTDQIRIQGGISGGSDYRIERVRLDDGTVLTHAQLLALSTMPTSGNDVFYGDETVNILNGGAGNDTLSGRQGNDTLSGGAGNDTVSGDGGDDTYVFNLGDGQDVIKDYNSGSWGGNDTIQFGPGIAAADLVVSQANGGQDLIIAIVGTTDQLRIQGGISGGSDYRIEQVRLDDGTVLTYAQLLALSTMPTAGNDVFYGDEAANTIGGGAGRDMLIGRGGGDTYVYSLGDDADTVDDQAGSAGDKLVLHGIAAADVVVVRNGNNAILVVGSAQADRVTILNQFVSSGQIEQVVFDDGTMWLAADLLSRATTTSGHTTHLGTEVAETIDGSSNADVIDGAGGGDILRGGSGGDAYRYAAGSGNDTIIENSDGGAVDKLLLVGLNAADVTLGRSGDHLFVTINTTGDQLKVQDHFYSTQYGLEQFVFADGTVWDRATIAVNAPFRGTSGNDTIYGTSGNDTFIGGLGNDTIRSGAGSDTHVYASGDGNDLIDEESGSMVEVDTLRFTDLNAADITLARSGVHVVVNVTGTGHQITLDEQYWSTTANWGVDRFEFADGTVWNRDQIMQNSWWTGTAGNDTMSGWASFDNINGGAGNDTINGNAGTDMIVGGAGNDTLIGGAGNDTFVFHAGFGKDVITDFAAGAGAGDVIEFDVSIFADFAAVMAAASASGSNTLITVDVDTTITLQNVTLANLNEDDFHFV